MDMAGMLARIRRFARTGAAAPEPGPTPVRRAARRGARALIHSHDLAGSVRGCLTRALGSRIRRAIDMTAQIHLFPCLQDNFGVLLHDSESGATAAIDAPEAAPVEAALKATGWKLTDILVTHHHADHTDGIAELKEKYHCRVVAPKAEAGKIPLVDETVSEGDTVSVGKLTANVIETPGHTLGHITYWFHGDKLAFAGDTLFSIGCGRVIEGTPEMMWASLKKLRDLPGDTQVYCGHEYTLANIKFCKTIEPDNADLAAREREVATL